MLNFILVRMATEKAGLYGVNLSLVGSMIIQVHGHIVTLAVNLSEIGIKIRGILLNLVLKMKRKIIILYFILSRAVIFYLDQYDQNI